MKNRYLLFAAGLAAFSVNGSAIAGCLDEIEIVRPQFSAAHATLSEEAHLQAEQVFGEAVSLCPNNREGDANLKIDELKKLLAN